MWLIPAQPERNRDISDLRRHETVKRALLVRIGGQSPGQLGSLGLNFRRYRGPRRPQRSIPPAHFLPAPESGELNRVGGLLFHWIVLLFPLIGLGGSLELRC